MVRYRAFFSVARDGYWSGEAKDLRPFLHETRECVASAKGEWPAFRCPGAFVKVFFGFYGEANSNLLKKIKKNQFFVFFT